jgi:hypothetical protein
LRIMLSRAGCSMASSLVLLLSYLIFYEQCSILEMGCREFISSKETSYTPGCG